MNAEILAIGTELLLGDILNTNAQFLSKELAQLGISVYHQTVVGDNADRIMAAYKNAFERADIVITTGGIGPTEDDMTKEVAAQFFNKKMVLDDESLKHIQSFFTKLGSVMTENNKKQAYIPEGAKILPNSKGTAPGCLIEENGKVLIMMPGPPSESTTMFREQVVPYLSSKSDKIFFSRTLRISGVGESLVEDMLKDVIDNQTNPSIAPYAKTFEVHLRITASAKDETEAQAIMKPTIEEIYNRMGDNIYGENLKTLEESVVELLQGNNLTLACAESCTGGMVCSKFVNCPGVSNVLLEGVVTYSNESKMKRLGVQAVTLEKYGAVSEETAIEMAEGIAKTSGADVTVATTGVAGPDGGTEEKPVGLVYIAVHIKGKTFTRKLDIMGDRDKIRTRTTVTVIDFLRRQLKNQYDGK